MITQVLEFVLGSTKIVRDKCRYFQFGLFGIAGNEIPNSRQLFIKTCGHITSVPPQFAPGTATELTFFTYLHKALSELLLCSGISGLSRTGRSSFFGLFLSLSDNFDLLVNNFIAYSYNTK